MKRRVLYAVVILVIIVGVAYLLWPQGEMLDIRGYDSSIPSRFFGWMTQEQKLFIHIKNIGGTTIQIYTIGILNTGNYSFYEDIVVPPQVECTIEFSMWGGPVNLITLDGSPPASGGRVASPNWSGNMTSGAYVTMAIYTRAGKVYTKEEIEVR